MKTYRAWIDEIGSNEDRKHDRFCVCHAPDSHTHYEGVHRCPHLRMIDIERDNCRVLLRLIYRRRPFYFRVIWFPRAFGGGKNLLRLGRREWCL